MLSRGCPADVAPDLPEPGLVVVGRDDAQHACFRGRSAIRSRFALHEDELEVVLDHRIRLVGLPEKASSAVYFVRCVRYLAPDDRRQVVEADATTLFLDRCMQRHHGVTPPVTAPRQTHVTDDTHQPPTGNQHPVGVPPHLLQLVEELLVVGHMAKLSVALAVGLERPVGRGRHHQVDAGIVKQRQVPSIVIEEPMPRGDLAHRLRDLRQESPIPRDPRQIALQVGQMAQLRRHERLQSPLHRVHCHQFYHIAIQRRCPVSRFTAQNHREHGAVEQVELVVRRRGLGALAKHGPNFANRRPCSATEKPCRHSTPPTGSPSAQTCS